MNQINPSNTFDFAGTQCNVFYANKGEGLPWHSHDIDHVSMCVSGSCAMRKGDKTLFVDSKSKPVLLTAPEPHEIEALEDNTIFINLMAKQKT